MADTDLILAAKATATEPVLADGQVGPLTANLDGRLRVASNPVVPSAYALTTAATTNAAVVKSSAGNLFEVSVFNSTAATVYVRLYNKASAPTVGTDVPIVVIPVPTNTLANIEFGVLGKRFAAGIAIAVTGAAANNDTTAVAAGALISASYN